MQHTLVVNLSQSVTLSLVGPRILRIAQTPNPSRLDRCPPGVSAACDPGATASLEQPQDMDEDVYACMDLVPSQASKQAPLRV